MSSSNAQIKAEANMRSMLKSLKLNVEALKTDYERVLANVFSPTDLIKKIMTIDQDVLSSHISMIKSHQRKIDNMMEDEILPIYMEIEDMYDVGSSEGLLPAYHVVYEFMNLRSDIQREIRAEITSIANDIDGMLGDAEALISVYQHTIRLKSKLS